MSSTLMRLDWDAIFNRLGEQPHDADFQLMNCDRCGQQYLVDDEILRLYIEPTLREHALMAQGEPWPRCRGCGAAEWDLAPAEAASTEWTWAVKSLSSMSDSEIRDQLKFTRRWFDLGIVDDASVSLAIREFRESDDQHDEHYRYRSFVRFLERYPLLTSQQCHELFDLGAEDPDWPMGTSIMLDILRRRECPDELYDVAAAHPRTTMYAEKMKRRRDLDPESFGGSSKV